MYIVIVILIWYYCSFNYNCHHYILNFLTAFILYIFYIYNYVYYVSFSDVSMTFLSRFICICYVIYTYILYIYINLLTFRFTFN